MDGKVGADFQTTVDISREGREGATAARSQPDSQATEANTAKPRGRKTAPKSSISGWKESFQTLRPVIKTPAAQKCSQCSSILASATAGFKLMFAAFRYIGETVGSVGGRAAPYCSASPSAVHSQSTG